MSDGKVVIAIDIQDKNSKSKIKELEGSFKGVDGTVQKASRSIKDMVVSLGLVKIASAAFRVLRDNIDSAITRVDTMNQFPKMMQAIGFGADDSNQAVERLLEGIQGLPTRLDEVVSTAQRLAIMTGDLETATELTLALNNAFLTSGASASDASRGMEQYTQMLATGKVDMQSWRTLQETMGVALNDVAKAFGFAGASAQNDLYSALQDGTITFDEFSAKLVELSNETGGFADRALIASEGIRTSFGNIKTAVINGLATMIQTVDQALQDGGFGSIAENLDRVKVAVQGAFGVINGLLPSLIESLFEFISGLADFIEKWDWLIVSIVAGITVFKLLSTVIPIIMGIYNAIQLWGGLVLMIRSIGDGITLLTMVFPLLASPVFLISAAIGALVAVMVYLYQTNETVRDALNTAWNFIKDLIMQVVDVISEYVQSVIGGLVTWWQENNQMILEAAQNVWNAIKTVIEVAMNVISSIMQTLWPMIMAVVKFAWDGIKNIIDGTIKVITGIIEFFSALFTGNWSAMWDAVKKIVSGAVQAIWGFIQLWIVGKIIGAIKAFAGLMKSLFSSAWAFVKNVFSSSLSWIGGKVSSGLGAVKGTFTTILNSLKGIVSSAFNAVKSAITGGMNGALNAVKNFFGKFKTAGSNIVGSIADGIKGAVGKVTGAISGVVSKVRDFLPFSPAKEGPLMDLDRLDFAGPMSDSIDKAKRPLSRAMNDLMESASVVMDDMINLPNGNGIIQRAVASGNAGSIGSSHVMNDNGVTIYIEKIENNSDGDIEEQLEEAVWIFDRNKGRL